MTEAMTKKVLDEIQAVKTKVDEMDKELHLLREEFKETHLTEEERKLIAEALDEECKGKTTSLEHLKKQLGI
jgi:hypothetical protein